MTDHPPGETPLAEPDLPAQITPADIERAKAAWERHDPPQMRHLLDAELEPPAVLDRTAPVPEAGAGHRELHGFSSQLVWPHRPFRSQGRPGSSRPH
jgi:hypothetical protein